MRDLAAWLGVATLAVATAAAQDRSRGSAAPLDEVAFAAATGVTTEAGAVLESTIVRNRSSARYLTWFRVDADLETMLGAADSEAFLELRSNGGTQLADDAGDAQGLSGLDAADGEQLSEFGLRSRFGGERLHLRLGVLDANSRFAAVAGAGNFMTASAGTSPTIEDLPTWPATAPGIELTAQLGDAVTVGGGVYDGTFAIGEIEFSWSPPPGRLALGFWRRGAYVLAEQQLWRPRNADARHGVFAFALYGRTDPGGAEIGQHTLCGLTWRGPLPRREDDEIGLLLSRVDVTGAADETTAEIYYKARLGASSSVQLGLQHVRQPSGDRTADDLAALGARFEVAF